MRIDMKIIIVYETRMQWEQKGKGGHLYLHKAGKAS